MREAIIFVTYSGIARDLDLPEVDQLWNKRVNIDDDIIQSPIMFLLAWYTSYNVPV